MAFRCDGLDGSGKGISCDACSPAEDFSSIWQNFQTALGCRAAILGEFVVS